MAEVGAVNSSSKTYSSQTQNNVEQNNNEYVFNKKLYISQETGQPTKLLINDINERTVVYILYNEISINDL